MWVDLVFVIGLIGDDTQHNSQNYKCNEEHGLLFSVKCRYDENPGHKFE